MQTQVQEKTYKVAEIARLTGFSPTTVKKVSEEIGVEPIRTAHNHRRFDLDGATRLVQALRDRKIGLADVLDSREAQTPA